MSIDVNLANNINALRGTLLNKLNASNGVMKGFYSLGVKICDMLKS